MIATLTFFWNLDHPPEATSEQLGCVSFRLFLLHPGLQPIAGALLKHLPFRHLPELAFSSLMQTYHLCPGLGPEPVRPCAMPVTNVLLGLVYWSSHRWN